MNEDNQHAGQVVTVTLIGLRDDVPFPIRLRRALKHLLRTERLKALEVAPVSPFRDAEAEPSGPQAVAIFPDSTEKE